jgi:hypothetical protein
LRTFQAGPLENQVPLSATAYVSELMYAASDADEDASTPDTKWYEPSWAG